MTILSESSAEQKLQELLPKGLAVVESRSTHKAGNRVTCVRAIDIDNDGDIEIIFGAADGRLTVLSKEGEVRWSRIVGDKSPVTYIAILSKCEGTRNVSFIIVGTDSGYLYIFNKDGQTVNKSDKTCNTFSLTGEEDRNAYWFCCKRAINQISITPDELYYIIFTSEDRHVYALNWIDGQEPWLPFRTDGWARCVFTGDFNNDGNIEILVSTANRYLYMLDHNGQLMNKRIMEHPIRTIFAEDINSDGICEIFVATDKRELLALTPDFEQLWVSRASVSRLRAIAVVDVDRDGAKEIIVGGDDKHLYILDGDGKIIWRHLLGARIVSICTGDIDGDGNQEVIIGADDERVHILRINLFWAREGLFGQIQQAYQEMVQSSADLPQWLMQSERELLRDLSHTGREEPIRLEEAERRLRQGHFQEALAAFLQLETQKVEVLWHEETGHEVRILCFGNILGNVIVGTIEGTLRALDQRGKELWSRQLPQPDQILSGQIGRIQNSRPEDILICSTGRHVYLIGYPSGKTRGKKNIAPEVLKNYDIDPLISSVALKPGYNPEIVLGSESQKIYVYQNGLEDSYKDISTQQGVHIVQPYLSRHKVADIPDVIAARSDNCVVAYKYTDEKELWKFPTWNRIRAMSVKDIDGDNHDEIIIGSADRNIHVVNYKGQLKWRYYLPYSVLATHVVDINQDGRLEVLAGCADGYLYVFNKDGDLLWKYQIDERITAIASREYEGTVEIMLGTENRVEMLQIIDSAYLRANIDRCWQGLISGQSETQVVKRLLTTVQEPALRAFALQKASVLFPDADKWALFTELVKDSSVEVRKSLISALMSCYNLEADKTYRLLEKLSSDRELEVRLELVEHIDQLMEYDWEVGFDFLVRFAQNIDRFVRRAVMRKLYNLINDRRECSWKPIFQLLLRGVCDQTVWIRQEAARSLAHYLDHQHWDLLEKIYRFIIKDVDLRILLHLAHHSTVPDVRATIEALVLIRQDDLNVANATERLQFAVQALQHIENSLFGADTLLLFKEHHILFNLETLQDIAQYQCQIKRHQPDPENQHFPIARRVFEALPNVTRILKIYLQRQNINDQISSLQEACRAIERLHHFMNNEYQTKIEGEPLTILPDYKFFELLFKRWREIIQTKLNDLRGKPEIKAELLTRQLYYEKRVSLLVNIQNIGRSPAYSVRVALLHSEDFIVIPPAVSHTEILFWRDFLRAEFTIQFHLYKENVYLSFEIIYDDGEKEFCKEMFTEHLTLRHMEIADYEFVPNPYSTGTPTSDKSMFFGRDHDIDLLKRELTLNTAQRIIVLHGLRRSGKTSLLRYLVKNEVLDDCIPVYIDMQNIIHEITTSRLFYKIAYAIQREVAKKMHIPPKLPTQTAFKDDPTFAFDRFLDSIEIHLHEQRIVLLIDEFEILQEQADQGLLSPTLFRYLRSLMQERNMNFLLAGTHKLEQLTKDYWSVFYSFALPHRLSKISAEGAQRLITVPVSQQLHFDSFAVDKLHKLSGDQPFLLNSLCRILVDHCNDLRKSYVTLNDVNIMIAHAIMINSIQFNGLWQQISQEERLALAVIAQGGRERPLLFAEIEEIYRMERISYEQKQLWDILGSLTQQDLLENKLEEEQEDLRYYIPIGLLVLWLNQEQPLSKLKQDGKRTYKHIYSHSPLQNF